MAAPLPRDVPAVIGVGASAGGIEALQRLMRELPEDITAAICLVLHIPATSRSLLAEIIDRQTPLPVSSAADGAVLRAGHMYVAPPDCHLRIRAGRVQLDRGPKENGVRPAIDPLFRSIATELGPRGTAVVLSGSLSDGAAGAAAVAAAGGTVLIQDPQDALMPGMPEAALTAVPTARAMSAPELADAMARRAAALPPAEPGELLVPADDPHPRHHPTGHRAGPPSALTCPECHGPLWELRHGELVRYRCRVGHVYGEDVLADGRAAAVEAALWMAVESLEERTELLGKVAARLAQQGHERAAERTRERARATGERAELIRGVLALDDSTAEDVAAGAT